MSPSEVSDDVIKPKFLMICVNRRFRADEASCAARGSQALADALELGIQQRKIDIKIERSVCLGHCQIGPSIRLAPGGRFILGKSMSEAEALLDELELLCGHRNDDVLPLDLLGS